MPTKQSNTLRQKWQQVLSNLIVEAERIAQSSQRQRKLSVERLVQTLVLGCMEQEKVSLRLWSEVAADLGCGITPSSLDERLTGRVVLLLYEILQSSIQQQVDGSQLPHAQLKSLSRMVLYDSTAIRLPASLKQTFRASRDTDLGHMKLQVGYDYLNAQLQYLSVHEGIEPDQKSTGLLEQAVAKALLIFDLGYFSQHTLAQIDQREAYFVSRYQSQTALYDPDTGEAIDLTQTLPQVKGDDFETCYLLGAQAQLAVRFVARRLPPQAGAKRRRQLKHRARKGRYTPSQRGLMLCDWDIVVTNLPFVWTPQHLFDLYGVRWQIELLFKAWKSYLDLADFGNWRAERVLVQLYATLIGAVLCQTSFAVARLVTHNGTTQESSLFKAICVIRRQARCLLPIIRKHWWGIGTWATDLWQALLKFAKQQNLKMAPSTLQYLLNWDLS